MKASNKRILSILCGVAILAAAIFVFNSFVKPAYADIQKKRSKIATLNNVIDQEADVINQIRGLIEQYKGQRQLTDALSLTFPIDRDMPSLVSDLSGLAQISGLGLKSITFKDLPLRKASNSLANSVGILEIQAKLSGPYDGLKSFLNSLETNVRVLDVQNISVESGIKNSQDLMEFVITADAYYQSKSDQSK